MIVVTGSARSGTSLMMQTLKLLGVPVEGHKFHEDFPIVEANPRDIMISRSKHYVTD